MTASSDILLAQGKAAKVVAHRLAFTPSAVKNQALENIARDLISQQDAISCANRLDYQAGEAQGMSAALLDRLMLSAARVRDMADGVRAVAALRDPIGEVLEDRTLENGLRLRRRRVPLGVLGAIYESRPNVTVDIAALCLKSGNAVILRGGKEAVHSNTILAGLVTSAAVRAGVPEGAVQFVADTDRALVDVMLAMSDQIDLIIPRGGAGLIRFVAENARMPVVTGGIGVCHTYVDAAADLDKAVAIAYNAKVQRPTVCNALDTVIVHAAVAAQYLPKIAAAWAEAGVELHADERALALLKGVAGLNASAATTDDWGREYLALLAGIKVVDSLEEALAFIETYGSGHSEAIISEDQAAVTRFFDEVDAACVYANASTRFTDGAQFGLGAEVGVSTQKMHGRSKTAAMFMASWTAP